MIEVKKNGDKVTVKDDGKIIVDVYKHFEAKVATRVNKTIKNLRTLKIDKTILTIK